MNDNTSWKNTMLNSSNEGEKQTVEKNYIHRRQRILLVDDERMVIDILHDMLSAIGHDVTSHISSIQAWQDFQTKPQAFDLVITDYYMPELAGGLLAQNMKNLRSDIPIILYTGTIEEINEDEMPFDAIVRKPITLGELVSIVNDVSLRYNRERRKDKRGKLPQGASIVPENDPARRYLICDISQGGVCMFIDDTSPFTQKTGYLTITTSKNETILEKIPCEFIYEKRWDNIYDIEPAKNRKQRAQFCGLSSFQKQQLENYLSNHAVFI